MMHASVANMQVQAKRKDSRWHTSGAVTNAYRCDISELDGTERQRVISNLALDVPMSTA